MKKILFIIVVLAAAVGGWLWLGPGEAAPEPENSPELQAGDDTDAEIDAELDSLAEELESADSGDDSELDSLEVEAQ